MLHSADLIVNSLRPPKCAATDFNSLEAEFTLLPMILHYEKPVLLDTALRLGIINKCESPNTIDIRCSDPQLSQPMSVCKQEALVWELSSYCGKQLLVSQAMAMQHD
jgi:hypothetical protein